LEAFLGRCSYDKLKHIEPALKEIRRLEKIKEPKPGIFYLKSQGFLHFHESEGKIWADVKEGDNWTSLDIPAKADLVFLKKFVNEVLKRYESSLKK
jgi:hypothetical protein